MGLRGAPGDGLQFMGPGGAYAPDPAADWHLMVGDEAVVPAIAPRWSGCPEGVPVHVILEVGGPEDEVALETPGDLRVTWLHRARTPGTRSSRPSARSPSRRAPSTRSSTARRRSPRVRRHLLVDRGIARDALSVSGYWKRGRTKEGWREDKAEWNRQVEADEAA